MPAKSKLTREVIKTIAGHVSKGLTNLDACRVAGINEATLYRWLKQADQAQSGLHLELREALKKAEAAFKQTHLDIIITAASTASKRTHKEQILDKDGKVTKTRVTIEEIPPPWQASGWLLERKFPEEFSTNQKRRRKRGR